MNGNGRFLPGRRMPGALGLGAALVALAGFVVVPAIFPLCTTEMGECGLVATAVTARGAHCSMETAGLGGMPCCVEDESPDERRAAPPGPTDAGLRLQVEAPAPDPTAGGASPPPSLTGEPPLFRHREPAVPPVPLYTLLATLLT